MQKKYLPAILCGFGGAVLLTVPGLKSVGCCLIVLIAAIMTLVVDRRMNFTSDPISTGNAVIWGLKTGLFLALFTTLFDVLVTYFVRSNELTQTLPQSEQMLRDLNLGPIVDETMQIMRHMSDEITTKGFSAVYTFGMLFSNLIVHTIFGMLGGLLGMVILNRRNQVR